MKFDDYQTAAMHTDRTKTNLNPVLGLAGEVGEIMELLKKATRITQSESLDFEELEARYPGFKMNLIRELGDVLWYVTSFARNLDVSLQDVALANLAKLHKRQQEGSLLDDSKRSSD